VPWFNEFTARFARWQAKISHVQSNQNGAVATLSTDEYPN